MGYTGNWLSGNATHADLLKFQKLFDQPLLHAPGSQYCYVNSNFQLAGYIVEKVCSFHPEQCTAFHPLLAAAKCCCKFKC